MKPGLELELELAEVDMQAPAQNHEAYLRLRRSAAIRWQGEHARLIEGPRPRPAPG
jgi:hypothetical protein